MATTTVSATGKSNLTAIAQQLGVSLATLKAANPQLERATNSKGAWNMIYPADVINIPSGTTSPTTPITPPANTPTNPTNPVNPTTPKNTIPTWNLSNWNTSGQGGWTSQPVLTIDGQNYTFSNP